MHKAEKYKLIIALIIATTILTSFFILGKDNMIVKVIGASGLAIWLISMVIINKNLK